MLTPSYNRWGLPFAEPFGVHSLYAAQVHFSALATVVVLLGCARGDMHRCRAGEDIGDVELRHQRKADAMYRDVARQDPDSLTNAGDHATVLIYAGRIEARLHQPESARRDLEQAQKMLEESIAVSPKNKHFSNKLEEARAVLKAFPNDTSPLVPH